MLAADDGAGIGARSPFRIPREGWFAILKRTWAESGDDNISLIAAGVAFYAFSAIVPLLASVVLSYGLFAEGDTIQRNIESVFSVLPREAATIVTDQLLTVVKSSKDKQGLGLFVALAIALYGVTKGASAVTTGLNVAYDVKETRGFVKLNLLYFGIVLGGVVLIFLAMLVTAMLGFLAGLIPGAPAAVLTLIQVLGYLLLAGLVALAAAGLFYAGPALPQPRFIWLSPGSVGATALWLAGTTGFGIYAANFGNYGATYGSLSAVIVLLTWLWLSAYVFLLGAELNAELERQVEGTAAADLPVSAPAVPAAAIAPPADPAAIAAPAEGGAAVQPRPTRAPSLASGGVTLATNGVIGATGLALLRRNRPVGFVAVGAAALLAWRKGARRAAGDHAT